MFNWYRAWKKRRQEEKTRAIFEFWDGQNFRKVDPWRAWRDIQGDPKFNLENHAELINNGMEPETTDCVECLARVFGVSRFVTSTGQGMTDGEIVGLLGELVSYLEGIQKKTLPGPTSLEPTQESTPEPSPASPNSLTNSPSPVCSISTEPSSAEASPSQPVSNTV